MLRVSLARRLILSVRGPAPAIMKPTMIYTTWVFNRGPVGLEAGGSASLQRQSQTMPRNQEKAEARNRHCYTGFSPSVGPRKTTSTP